MLMPLKSAGLSLSPANMGLTWLPWHSRFNSVLWSNSLLEACSLSCGTTTEASSFLLALTQRGTCRAAVHRTTDTPLLGWLLFLSTCTPLMLHVVGRACMSTAPTQSPLQL